MIWVCAVCLDFFDRQVVFETLELFCKLSLQSCELHSFNINVYAKLRGNNSSADLTVRMHWLTCVMLFACQQDQFSYDNAHIRECSG